MVFCRLATVIDLDIFLGYFEITYYFYLYTYFDKSNKYISQKTAQQKPI